MRPTNRWATLSRLFSFANFQVATAIRNWLVAPEDFRLFRFHNLRCRSGKVRSPNFQFANWPRAAHRFRDRLGGPFRFFFDVYRAHLAESYVHNNKIIVKCKSRFITDNLPVKATHPSYTIHSVNGWQWNGMAIRRLCTAYFLRFVVEKCAQRIAWSCIHTETHP